MQVTQPNTAVTVWDVFAERFYFWFDDVFITQADYFDDHTTHPFAGLGFIEENYVVNDANAHQVLVTERPYGEAHTALQNANVKLKIQN